MAVKGRTEGYFGLRKFRGCQPPVYRGCSIIGRPGTRPSDTGSGLLPWKNGCAEARFPTKDKDEAAAAWDVHVPQEIRREEKTQPQP